MDAPWRKIEIVSHLIVFCLKDPFLFLDNGGGGRDSYPAWLLAHISWRLFFLSAGIIPIPLTFRRALFSSFSFNAKQNEKPK
jgi:hypothetical protein